MESTALLRHVANVIRTRPETFNMRQWMEDYETGAMPCSVSEMLDLANKVEWSCGTTACIAGHAIIADPERSREVAEIVGDGRIEDVGAGLLGLNYKTAVALFYQEESRPAEAYAVLLDWLAEMRPEVRMGLGSKDMRDLLNEAEANA